MPESKSYGTSSKNRDLWATQKKSQKVRITFLQFLSSKIIFLSTCEALIQSIWTSNVKVMDNLGFGGNLSIMVNKQPIEFIFECNFYNFSKKVVKQG